MYKVIDICVLIICLFNLCRCKDEAWSSFQSTVLDQNREELVVTNVISEKSFLTISKILKWKSLTIGSTCYSLGLSEKGLESIVTVLNPNNTEFQITNSFHATENTPSDGIIFDNRNNGKSEAIFVISFYNQNKISWFKISDQNRLQEFWSWTVERPVEHVNILKMGTRHLLFFIANNKFAYLYEFNIKTKPFERWFIQMIPLESISTSSAFNNVRGQFFLSIPQINSVSIYKYSENKFKNFTKIEALQVTAIVNFEVVFKTFIAVDGLNAGIYEFSDNGLVRREVGNSNLNALKLWLPIPIQTYKDEVLLLAQKVLDHSTHRTVVVDIITYNNDHFIEHEDIKCSHFGETADWLACLTYDKGILGATYIIIEDKIGLLVPGTNLSLDLFTIHTAIKENPNPKEQEIHELLKTKEELEVLIKQNQEDFDEIAKSIKPVAKKFDITEHQKEIVGEPQDLTTYLKKVEQIGWEVNELFDKAESIVEKENGSKYNTIIVNGVAKFEDLFTGEEMEVKNINDEDGTALLNDIVSKENINNQLKNKTFEELEVENLKVNTVNGIDTKNMAFKDEPEIVLYGIITFAQFVMVQNISLTTKMINDIYFEDEVISLDKKLEGTLDLDQIKEDENLLASRINNVNLQQTSRNKRNLRNESEDTLFIPHNLTVTFINGENFTEFLHSLCMVNKICVIPGSVKIQEEIHADEVDTDYLNNLKFPDEYVLLNGKPTANIIGNKYFNKSLQAEEVRSTGEINKINTDDLITLSTEQNLKDISFKNFQLTEKLTVDGKILGEYVKNILTNPTLIDVSDLQANANFKNLEVMGNIFVENKFNDKNLKTLLENILYSDAEDAVISTTKEFSKGVTVTNQLKIKSNSINTAKLSNFVTKDTDQNLKINLLKGDVIIKNLIVNGTYSGQNIKELDESLVKLSGDQFIDSVLTFNDLVVNNLEIDQKLNEVKANEYLYTTENDIYININFSQLVVENLNVEGNIDGEIMGYDLNTINNTYLSLTKSQSIEPVFHINDSVVDRLNCTNVNNSSKDAIFRETTYNKMIEKLLNNGYLAVENLHVSDSIYIDNVNDKPTTKIMPVTVLDMAKNTSKLVFQNELYLKDIEIINFGSVNFNEYLQQIVYKNQTNTKIIFRSDKNFIDGISVENLIETKKINNIPVRNVLTKEGKQRINGPVELIGDLSLENVHVKETINEAPVKDVLKMLLLLNKGSYYHTGDMVFKRLPYIESLQVNGTINDKNIEDLFKELVYQNSSTIFKKDFIFTKPVNISRNLAITQYFNNLNFSDIMSKIVFITEDDDVDSIVSFYKNVDVQVKTVIAQDLSTKLIKRFNPSQWQEKALYIDKGLVKGHFKMDSIEINTELTTPIINSLNMENVVPLKLNQSINFLKFRHLKFAHNITVGNTVNGLFLPQEIKRTMMMDKDQDILPTTVFKNILVRQNLKTDLLNNKNTSKIVTTNTNQNLNANYTFQSKVTMESDLNVSGLINRVDYENWKENSLKLNSNKTARINSEWKVFGNVTFKLDVYAQNKMSDLDFPKIATDIQDRKDFKYQFEHGIISDWNGICKTITSFYQEAKSQIYKFKYFEDFQELSFKHSIQYVFNFDFNKTQYILINYDTCSSDLMIYNGTKFVSLLSNLPTGLINQIVPVSHENDEMFLVIQGNTLSSCNTIMGTNVWKFNGIDLQLNFNMENQDLLQDSLAPSTFFSLNKEGVIEYKIKNSDIIKYRKWEVFEDNIAFIPRGLKTGLALRTGKKIIYLVRSDPVVDFELDVEAPIKGYIKTEENHFIPGKKEGVIAVLKTGIKSARRNMLAIATHEKAIVEGSLDLIKIYEDPLLGKLFGKVPSYKPSSLISIDFDQGETLLIFLENKRKIQIYEYKGIEGFKLRYSIKIKKASRLFKMDLTGNEKQNSVKLVGIVYKNNIRLMQAVMEGTKIRDDLKCTL